MVEDFVRLNSGIPGLDDMIEGGFPFPSSILVAGSAGTGKTTFGLQFLFEGARRGEQGLYFSTYSEPTEWVLRFTSRYRFVDQDFLGKEIKYIDLARIIKSHPHKVLEYIEEQVAEQMPQRIVIDPITIVGNLLGASYRAFLFDLSTSLKNFQAVTLLTGEVKPDEDYPLEVAYTSDSIILLSNKYEENGRRRFMEVLKMRGSDHITGRHMADISQ
ncbi:KaiA-binding protein, partial [bacterium]|nr:KaiA-binding protein [bacterium]